MNHPQSQRLQELPPYIFSELNRLKAEALARGQSLLSLAIGDPDRPTPQGIVQLLQEAVARPENHAYSPYEGTLAFRRAVSNWFENRFQVSLDPKSEVVALIGSKEGVAHFPVAFCNPGDAWLYPDPGYPVFASSITLAGGKAVPIPLRVENGLVPSPQDLEALVREHKPKGMILNHPANPTSAVVKAEQLEPLVEIAKKSGMMLLFDNAYSEIYYDPKNRPISALQIPGAKDIAIELHSFSKTFNMTGWRLGYAVGNPSLIAGLLRAKTQIDSGPLLAVQDACARLLPRSEEFAEPIRQVYASRRETLLAGLDRLGIEYFPFEATFFVWARVPKGRGSMDFTKELLEKAGVVVTPGIGFGQAGEGFFRLALTVDNPKIEEALQRLSKVL